MRTQQMMPPAALTIPEVCAALRTSRTTVYQLIKTEQLLAFRIGNRWRVDQAALEAFKVRQRAGTAGVVAGSQEERHV